VDGEGSDGGRRDSSEGVEVLEEGSVGLCGDGSRFLKVMNLINGTFSFLDEIRCLFTVPRKSTEIALFSFLSGSCKIRYHFDFKLAYGLHDKFENSEVSSGDFDRLY
jgi:hypothetical protein